MGIKRHIRTRAAAVREPLYYTAVLVLLLLAVSYGPDIVHCARRKKRAPAGPKYPVSANPATAGESLRYVNKMFRFQSSIFNASSDQLFAAATLPNSVDWRTDARAASVQSLRTEGSCKSSWAITAVAAVESAYAIATSALPPLSMTAPANLSVQQVVDCEPGKSSCSGGWPIAALDYMADATKKGKGLVAERAHPFIRKTRKCNKAKLKTFSDVQVIGYDQVDFFEMMGLLLTLVSQPAIVYLRGSHESFQDYNATSGIYSDPACALGPIDHSVLVVGYNIDPEAGTEAGAYWIIRNSWGPNWGMGGYMHIAISQGIGTCGMHTLPAIVPVVKTPTPCSSGINPCGGGVCIGSTDASGKQSYTCKCPFFFTNVTNTDGTPTCVFWLQCLLHKENPCAVGTCLDTFQGTYVCICPPGFAPGLRPLRDTPTCVPNPKGQQTLTFPFDVACELVFQMYGLTSEQFLNQNPGLNGTCENKIPANLRVNVTRPPTAINCSLYYSWQESDNCSGVESRFNVSEGTLASANPGISCDPSAANKPVAYQQLCLQQGNGTSLSVCTQWFTTSAGDTCESITDMFGIDIVTFYTLNPGFSCSSLGTNSEESEGGSGGFFGGFAGSGGAQVCVNGYMIDSSAKTVQPKRLMLELRRTQLPQGTQILRNQQIQQTPQISQISRISQVRLSQIQQFIARIPLQGSHQKHRLIAPAALPPPRPRPKCKTAYRVTKGDFCARIIAIYFQNSAKKLADLNYGYICNNQRLYVGLSLCTKL